MISIGYIRFTDKWGAKIALNKVPFNLKDEMKVALPFPKMGWDGERGMWAIQDRADVIEAALAFLADNDIAVEGLEFDESLIDIPSNASATFSPPDKLILNWDFQPNWKDINAAMKGAAAGNARWQNNTKSWMIPIATAMAVANAVQPHFEPLSDAIEANEEVQKAHGETLQRVELSSAVETEIELPDKAPFFSMRPYQQIAPIMYTTGGRNRILIADEMGLGKTLQALACVELAQHKRILIVCPAIVKHNWANEIDKWLNNTTASCSTYIINGWEGIISVAKFNIINYDILHHRKEQLMEQQYDCIIFDEVHRVKDTKTNTTKAALEIVKSVKDGIIALSGTPVTNRPMEFYPILSMMLPATFSNFFEFARKYCDAKKNYFGWDYSGASNITDSADVSITPLNHILRDFMLRRSMDDPRIAGEMPSLVETIVSFDLDDVNKSRYKQSHNSWMGEWVTQQQQFGSTDAGFALNMMTGLRHEAGLAKVEQAVKWATTYLDNNNRPLVIFAHHRDVIEGIEWRLREATKDNCIVRVITGVTPNDERQMIIDEFQAGGSEFLICSTNAMREGVNLDKANTTLFVEREWVPAWEQQAAARVRRMTQTESTCHKVVLSANDTIDVLFDQVVAEKAFIVNAILDGGDTDARDKIGQAILKKLKEGKGSLI